MPWQDNSGKNGSDRGPWGQPPRNGGGNNNNGGGNRGGGGGEPPDLEELLQASRQRLKRAFPRRGGNGGRGGSGGGGFEMNKPMMGLIGAGVVGLWLASGIYQVEPNELAVVTTFGEYKTVTGPGLHWRIPGPVQNVIKQPAQAVQEMNIPINDSRAGQLSQGLMLTGDKNIVDIAFTIQWKIKSGLTTEQGQSMPGVAQYVFNVDGPKALVRMVGEAAMREIVGRNTLDFVQTNGRSQIQEQTEELIQATLDEQQSGIQIEQVNLTGTEPPTQEVNEAFRDVQAAEQNQATVIQEARQYTNKVVPEARGQAQRILETAGAYASERTADARGQASRFDEIYAEYAKAPEVTRQRMYLETVEGVLGGMDKIIIDKDVGSGVVPYLPLNELNKQGGN